jgi:predicted DCC family thiol-disulfide oxidoreductase YuxK
MAEGLGFPWSLAGAFRAVPRVLRDPMYDFIARNRLRFFGKRDSCYLPDPRDQDRFLA